MFPRQPRLSMSPHTAAADRREFLILHQVANSTRPLATLALRRWDEDLGGSAIWYGPNVHGGLANDQGPDERKVCIVDNLVV